MRLRHDESARELLSIVRGQFLSGGTVFLNTVPLRTNPQHRGKARATPRPCDISNAVCADFTVVPIGMTVALQPHRAIPCRATARRPKTRAPHSSDGSSTSSRFSGPDAPLRACASRSGSGTLAQGSVRARDPSACRDRIQGALRRRDPSPNRDARTPGAAHFGGEERKP